MCVCNQELFVSAGRPAGVGARVPARMAEFPLVTRSSVAAVGRLAALRWGATEARCLFLESHSPGVEMASQGRSMPTTSSVSKRRQGP